MAASFRKRKENPVVGVAKPKWKGIPPLIDTDKY
jgi:hypothetical protein